MSQRKWILILLTSVLLSGSTLHRARAQAPGFADITHPRQGEVITGIVTIEGSAAHPSFKAYELSFCYDPNPMDTWFPIINPVQTPVSDGRLGIWDTTNITDGNYQLRLRVILENDRYLEAIVTGLRIRNTTPIETSTPAPAASLPSPTPLTPTKIPRATPMPLPVTGGPSLVLRAFSSGGFVAIAGLLLLGGYTILRRYRRLHWSSGRVRPRRQQPKSRRGKNRRGS